MTYPPMEGGHETVTTGDSPTIATNTSGGTLLTTSGTGGPEVYNLGSVPRPSCVSRLIVLEAKGDPRDSVVLDAANFRNVDGKTPIAVRLREVGDRLHVVWDAAGYWMIKWADQNVNQRVA